MDGLTSCSVPDYENPIGSPPYTEWGTRDWFDPAAYTWMLAGVEAPPGFETTDAADDLRLDFDGAMIGSPFTAGWPDKTYSWAHVTWECCKDNDGCSTGCWQQKFYGASSGTDQTGADATDALMPPTASGWTDNYTAGLLRPGSWWDFNGGTDFLMLQKQCEVKVTFPGHNFFRPCGAERWMMDTAVASCVTLIDGDTIYCEDDMEALGLTTNDHAVFYDGPNALRVFEVASVAGNVLTLGTELDAPGIADTYAPWDVAFAASPDSSTGDYGIVGKVRWPGITPWAEDGEELKGAICGRAKIASATQDGSNLNLTLTTAVPYLRSGDKIVFIADADATAADTVLDDNTAAGYPVTVTDSTHLIITATRDAAKHLGYIKSFGAPDTKWNSAASRTDLVLQEWPDDPTTGDFKTVPVNTDDRAPAGRVLGSTPNGDTESTWITTAIPSGAGYPFPPLPTATTCGGKRLVHVIQYVPDPLFQAPFACASPAPTICVPRVEAMTQTRLAVYLAQGAPALPSGLCFALAGGTPDSSSMDVGSDTTIFSSDLGDPPGPIPEGCTFASTPPAAAGHDCESSQPNQHECPWIACA